MNHILIGTDFSQPADNAVRYGGELARFFDARIILVHAYSLPLRGLDISDPLGVLNELEVLANQRLNGVKAGLIRQLGFDPGIQTIAGAGRPLELLRVVCDQRPVDLVVVGMTGEAGLVKRHVIGSTALGLSERTSPPVLIVPAGAKYAKVRRIALAWEGSLYEKPTLLHTARALAAAFGAALEVVTAAGEPVEAAEPAMPGSPDEFKSVLIASEGSPGEALERHFTNDPPDLIMACPRRHGFIHRLLHEGVIARLAFKLQTPLLTVSV